MVADSMFLSFALLVKINLIEPSLNGNIGAGSTDGHPLKMAIGILCRIVIITYRQELLNDKQSYAIIS
eukprot:scaffold236225_cov84-Attheya_sp.AAC.1